MTEKMANPANIEVPLLRKQTRKGWLKTKKSGSDSIKISWHHPCHEASHRAAADSLVEIVVEFVVRAQCYHRALGQAVGEKDLRSSIDPYAAFGQF